MDIKFEKLTGLVIENSPMMRTILREMLDQFGLFETVLVASAEEAIQVIEQRVFDFIILDFFLGKLDGGDFARLLRRSGKNPNQKTPILLITALPEHEKVEKARDCGINEMLAKPISAKGLYLRLHTMLTKPRQFVDTKTYVGPCRRRKNGPLPKQGERRKTPNIHKQSPETTESAC